MIYKRNKRKLMDPNRINKYNKFLGTLDSKQATANLSYIINNISQNTDKTTDKNVDKEIDNLINNNVNKKIVKTEDQLKIEIDEIIEKMLKTFKINEYDGSNFTGHTSYDSIFSNIKIYDPNYYMDSINKNTVFNYVPIYKTETVKPKKREKDNDELLLKPENDIRDTIFIQTEIKDISDILNLIKTYNLDPMIKYNINMKALHDIKEPLEELNNMIGLANIKTNIVDQILYFVQGLHKNVITKTNDKDSKKGPCDFMHTVIYGPPGTGKTDVAKIMGKIYSKLGILSKGTFAKVTRSDLIAGYLGQTAIKTKDVIKDALGGVLFIDEAYSLGNSDKRDSFSKECIDTLCEALSDYKDNFMVIIAGYEKELKDCFFSQNQGLDSRFTWRFKTDEYSGDDLYHIFIKKVKDIGWELADNSKINAEWFIKNKEYFRFYGRDIETVLAKTKITHSRRVFCMPETDKKKLIIDDLDNGFKIYIQNDDIKSRKEEEYKKKMLCDTLYC